MAEVPVREIVNALADALRSITVANGYNTDLGQVVATERRQTGLPDSLRCTVACVHKARAEGGGGGRPSIGRQVRGVIEIEVPASYENAMDTIYAADEDIDRCLRQYHQMPGALPVNYDETVFEDRPEGMPVCGAGIGWSTGYRPREDG